MVRCYPFSKVAFIVAFLQITHIRRYSYRVPASSFALALHNPPSCFGTIQNISCKYPSSSLSSIRNLLSLSRGGGSVDTTSSKSHGTSMKKKRRKRTTTSSSTTHTQQASTKSGPTSSSSFHKKLHQRQKTTLPQRTKTLRKRKSVHTKQKHATVSAETNENVKQQQQQQLDTKTSHVASSTASASMSNQSAHRRRRKKRSPIIHTKNKNSGSQYSLEEKNANGVQGPSKDKTRKKRKRKLKMRMVHVSSQDSPQQDGDIQNSKAVNDDGLKEDKESKPAATVTSLIRKRRKKRKTHLDKPPTIDNEIESSIAEQTVQETPIIQQGDIINLEYTDASAETIHPSISHRETELANKVPISYESTAEEESSLLQDSLVPNTTSVEIKAEETVDSSPTAFSNITYPSSEMNMLQTEDIPPHDDGTNETLEIREAQEDLPEDKDHSASIPPSEVDNNMEEYAEDDDSTTNIPLLEVDNNMEEEEYQQNMDEAHVSEQETKEDVTRSQESIGDTLDELPTTTSSVLKESISLQNDTDVRGGDAVTSNIESKMPPFQEEDIKTQSTLWVLENPTSTVETTDGDNHEITVSVVTWNLGEESPSENDIAFIKRFRKSNQSLESTLGSDLVMIGCQETEDTKPRRSEGHRSRELRRLEIKMLGKNYIPLALHSLGGVQFALFCRRKFLHEVELVQISDVACGVGNVFHNKGAIGAFVQLKARNGNESSSRSKSIKMLFVISHLAAHVKQFEARNADYWRIVSELEAAAPPRFLSKRLQTSDEVTSLTSGSHLMQSVDRVFWGGDLNYRLDLPREFVEQTILKMQELQQGNEAYNKIEASTLMKSLLRHDQLLKSISEGSAFVELTEGRISFIPTFKFDKGTLSYDSSKKQRIPAWTDRILFKPQGTRLLEYTSVLDATHSDHRPVYASFKVSMIGRERVLVNV